MALTPPSSPQSLNPETVLILGEESDFHAAHVYQAVRQAGWAVAYWNTAQFPTQTQLSLLPQENRAWLTLPSGQHLDLAQVRGVYWRSFRGSETPDMPAEAKSIAQWDAQSLLRSLLHHPPIRWVNGWDAYQFHQEKPRQLAQVHRLGVRIPATLVSNQPEALQTFAQRHPSLIFKPVFGGSHTQQVTPQHLETERLVQLLRLAPVTLQQYIPGTNVRSYVLGDRVYTAEIRSEAIDFREDPQAELIALDPPPQVKQWCLAIARSLLLTWTAIDWRVTPDGDYYFLEANPSPMFYHFEQKTGFPITDDLVGLLTCR